MFPDISTILIALVLVRVLLGSESPGLCAGLIALRMSGVEAWQKLTFVLTGIFSDLGRISLAQENMQMYLVNGALIFATCVGPIVLCTMIAGLLAGSTAVIAPAAFAQPQMPGWYVGGSLGQSDFKELDDEDTAWKIFGGYEINRNFAVELGYTNLGEVSRPGASVEATAWELVGVGSFPVADRFSIYGKLGGYRAETEARLLGLSRDESNNGITYGVGAQYDFTRTVGVRAEWQRYADVGDDNVGGEGDIDVLSVGLRVKF